MATIEETKKALADSVRRYDGHVENLQMALRLCKAGKPRATVICALVSVYFSPTSCALCRMFNPRMPGSENFYTSGNCDGCPVRQHTGESFCVGSPFSPLNGPGLDLLMKELDDALAMAGPDMKSVALPVKRLLKAVKAEHAFLTGLEVEGSE